MNAEDASKRMAEWDQRASAEADLLPLLWRRLYNGSLAAGFTPEESLSLLRAFIHGICGGRFEG